MSKYTKAQEWEKSDMQKEFNPFINLIFVLFEPQGWRDCCPEACTEASLSATILC